MDTQDHDSFIDFMAEFADDFDFVVIDSDDEFITDEDYPTLA